MRRTAVFRHLHALVLGLVLALCASSLLGVLHGSVHLHAGEAVSAASADGEAQAPAADFWVALFGSHDDAQCRLYDQLSHGPAALAVPLLFLPQALPRTVFVHREGVLSACQTASFEARGPPHSR